MFDGSERRDRVRVTPRTVLFAGAYLLLIGVMIGILIGRRRWEFWDWGSVFLQLAIFFRLFYPVYGDLILRLKDHNGE
jgi:hypothetical protein